MDTIPIDNQALVTELFGYWPAFHDAEIESIYLRRNEPGYWPAISLWIVVDGPLTNVGSEVQISRLWRIELEFTEVVDNHFEGFNHQNVIFSFSFQQSQEGIICSIETSYGLSGSITARRVTVKSVTPCCL
ncbi:MAG: hypothetical protein EOO56_26025 [Hymenobacter sp.]|nr:MAG: hypothetical protein EOO56_26025 [Hymenobacter sp.]